MVKNLPVNVGDVGSILSLGRFPHGMGQQSPCATTTESMLLTRESQLLKSEHSRDCAPQHKKQLQ